MSRENDDGWGKPGEPRPGSRAALELIEDVSTSLDRSGQELRTIYDRLSYYRESLASLLAQEHRPLVRNVLYSAKEQLDAILSDLRKTCLRCPAQKVSSQEP